MIWSVVIATGRSLCSAEQLSVLVADGREVFAGDWVRQRAAERLFEIIGEA